MKKVRKFSAGGMDDYDSSDDAKNLLLAAEREDVERIGEDFAKTLPKEEKAAPSMKKASFKEAFAEALDKQARGLGGRIFEWNGKKYTTDLASDKKSAPSKSSAKPKIDEGKTSSGMPREARGVADARTPGQKYAARQEAAATKMGGAYKDSVSDIKRKIKDLLNYNPRLSRERASMQEIDSNFKAGGKVSSASKRADGCAVRGKTRGRMM